MWYVSSAGEFDSQGSSESSPVCARQPRTLSMAIVPGEHIRTIMLAKQLNTTETSDENEPHDIVEGRTPEPSSDARHIVADCAPSSWH